MRRRSPTVSSMPPADGRSGVGRPRSHSATVPRSSGEQPLVRRLRLAFAAVAIAAMVAFLVSSFRQPAEAGIAAACVVQRRRRPRCLGEHLVRHVRAHRGDARTAHPLERLVRPDPVLRHRLSGAAAEHAGAGADAAAAVLRRPAGDVARGAAAGAAQPVDRMRSAPAPGSRPGSRSRSTSSARSGCPHPAVLLVSDLDDDSGDVDRVSQAAIAYRRAGIPLHVVGLNAAPGGRGVHPPVRDREGLVRAGGAPVRAGEWLLAAASIPGSSRWRCSPLSASAASCSWRSRCAGGHRERPADRRSASARSCSASSRSRWRTTSARGRRRIDRGDARFAAQPAAARWDAGTWLPGDPALAAALAPRRPRGAQRREGVRRRAGGADGLRRRAPEGPGSAGSPSSRSPTRSRRDRRRRHRGPATCSASSPRRTRAGRMPASAIAARPRRSRRRSGQTRRTRTRSTTSSWSCAGSRWSGRARERGARPATSASR